MKLRELAKEYQELLRDGILSVIIWKEGRSWNALTLYNWNEDKTDLDDVKTINEVRVKDPNAIIVDGYNCFAAYTLTYIERQIKKLYEAEAPVDPTAKTVKLYRNDEGFATLIKEAKAAREIDTDYSRHLSEYATTISQANGFVYTMVENLDNGTYYSIEKAPGVAFVVTISEKDKLVGGEIIKTIEEYRPQGGGPGYDVIVVKAVELGEIQVEYGDGSLYKAEETNEEYVSTWGPVNSQGFRGKREDWAMWNEFLGIKGFCSYDVFTGNRPCDNGTICDKCAASSVQGEYEAWVEEKRKVGI